MWHFKNISCIHDTIWPVDKSTRALRCANLSFTTVGFHYTLFVAYVCFLICLEFWYIFSVVLSKASLWFVSFPPNRPKAILIVLSAHIDLFILHQFVWLFALHFHFHRGLLLCTEQTLGEFWELALPSYCPPSHNLLLMRWVSWASSPRGAFAPEEVMFWNKCFPQQHRLATHQTQQTKWVRVCAM